MKTFEVKTTKTTIKKYHYKDLPIYTIYDSGVSLWYYRCRNAEGRTKCDVVRISNNFDQISYEDTSLSAVFSEENKKATEDDWNNAIHKLMNYIRK
tara:strand:+ start:2137 stop:2424 length:288 start_codon:yes stop_codon:yes gene_type:complete